LKPPSKKLQFKKKFLMPLSRILSLQKPHQLRLSLLKSQVMMQQQLIPPLLKLLQKKLPLLKQSLISLVKMQQLQMLR